MLIFIQESVKQAETSHTYALFHIYLIILKLMDNKLFICHIYL